MRQHLTDILAYGPIVAVDEDLGLLVTVNGSYYNLWSGDQQEGFVNTYCTPTESTEGLHTLTVSEAIKQAEKIIEQAYSEIEE